MKTANLISVSADHSAQYIVDYNLQDEKTEGSWRGMKPVNQQDLISFKGESNLPGLSIQQKGKLLKEQMASASQAQQHKHGQPRNPNRAQCHTVVQSYELLPNRDLTPKAVHQMGNELYGHLKGYFHDRYGYNLDTGLVSTHIDRDQDVMNEKAVANPIRHAHLHNHIVLPGFNDNGESIAPYLRKNDIYSFQHMNDGIASRHGLRDYYFSKLERQVSPFSAYTQNEYGKPKKEKSQNLSRVQFAWFAFKRANDYAWDKDKPMKNGSVSHEAFAKAHRDRDDFLRLKFHFSTKTVKDKKNHKPKKVFRMGSIHKGHGQWQQWYNLNNMRILRWRNRKEMRAERLIWQFNFNGLLNKAVSFRGYKDTIKYATRQLPDLGKIVKPNLRQKFEVNLASAYRHVEKGLKLAKKQAHNAKIKMTNEYRQLSKYGKQFMSNTRNFYNRIHHNRYKRDRNNFLVNGINRTIDDVHKERTNSRQLGHNRKPVINRNYTFAQNYAPHKSVARKKQNRRIQGPNFE